MEVSFHRKWTLRSSFFSVGRIVCRENRQSTEPLTAPLHPTSGLQHWKGGNDSRDIHPAPIALPTTDEENLPPIAHEDLVKLGVESRSVPSLISTMLRAEHSPNGPPPLDPAEAENLVDILDKVLLPP